MTRWRERTVDVDGPVRVVEYGGSGPRTFVCVHGLGGWAMDWQLLASGLTRWGRVVALDLPGFGDSPLAGRATSLDAHQRLLGRFLAAEADRPVVLLGNSMGATVALLHAARRPTTVDRLVLVSPVLPTSPRRRPHPLVTVQFLLYSVPGVGEWFVRARRDRIDHRRLVDMALSFLTTNPELVPREVYEERYALIARHAATADSDQAFLGTARSLMLLLAEPGRYRHVIRRVRVPTLVVHGSDDRLVSARCADHLTRLRPDWAVTVLPQVGHVAQLEAPRAVTAAVERWMFAVAATPAESAG
ncbi:MAG TPA: alpha/beta hydrolase [Euzebyales bacterium]|nr:alpha/beta hydrolase [Euzebyales bacterium]